MTILVHRVPISPAQPFDLDSLKQHIRETDNAEEGAVIGAGLTAAAEIEQFAQIALLTQTIRVTVFDPQTDSGMRLPIGPVADGDTPTVLIDGVAFTDFEFVAGNRPYLRWNDSFHNLSPCRINVEYQAGFGDNADAIPVDLLQALMDQAALHYDGRAPMDSKALTSSPHMARVGARYRGVQL